MLLPMLVMAVLAVCAGWLNATGAIDSLLGDGTKHAWTTGIFGVLTHSLTWISLLMAAAGIFLAWAIYVKRWFSAERISSRFALPYFFFINKYWFDEIYNIIIGNKLLNKGIFSFFEKLDERIIDGAVNGIARLTSSTGSFVRRAQNGRLQTYLLFFAAGLAILVLMMVIIS
jgi:NADH-quinone oxidoreductase subunit L